MKRYKRIAELSELHVISACSDRVFRTFVVLFRESSRSSEDIAVRPDQMLFGPLWRKGT